MKIRECVDGVLSRLRYSIYFEKNGKNFVAHGVQNKQEDNETTVHIFTVVSQEGIHEPAIHQNIKKCGSWLTWDSEKTWLVGDGSEARICRRGDNLVIFQYEFPFSDYESHAPGVVYEPPEWKIPIISHLCKITEIKKLEFETGGGWHGECYPERKYNNHRCPECGKIVTPQYSENEWVCILHRSTGAVTIEREFPFDDWNHSKISLYEYKGLFDEG